jgi:DNA-binding Lrp family transcriptional regulator
MNREEEHRLISLRQSRIAELAQGYTNHSEIARELNVSEPTVSRDIKFLNRQAQENLKFHVERRIPFEIEMCYTGLKLVLRKAFEITNLENAKISERIAALHVILTTYDKISEVLQGLPTLNELIKKHKMKREQLQEAANEILREREKDRERKRLGLTIEEYEVLETDSEGPNHVAWCSSSPDGAKCLLPSCGYNNTKMKITDSIGKVFDRYKKGMKRKKMVVTYQYSFRLFGNILISPDAELVHMTSAMVKMVYIQVAM